MIVISMKLRKLRAALLLCGIAAIFLVTFFAVHAANDAVETAAPLQIVEGNEQRIAFLEGFGWAVSPEPIEIVEVIIPSEFSEVYQNYNDIQKLQGYDLMKFRAKRVKRYTYEVTNYPSDTGSPRENVRANMLVYDGRVIGGDICSTELAGFMHGFTLTD